MSDISYFQDIPKLSIQFIEKLNQDQNFNYHPVMNSSTGIGRKINMGYNCYAVKLYKLANEWDNLNENRKLKWIKYLEDYQQHENHEYVNYFVDPEVKKYFDKYLSIYNFKSITKGSLNLLLNKNYEEKNKHIFKTLNADSKQTISTLNEIGIKIQNSPDQYFKDYGNVEGYLNSYDWKKPWDAGAQFSSISLYNETFNLGLDDNLNKFIESKLDENTGSYFDTIPDSPRQIINGAMKVLSGLDWLNCPVHLPEKLIDFCLQNKPKFEGCDLVDYIYVLYKCSIQTDYKKKEINELLKDVLNYLKLLYKETENGFSYYIDKSQTHYYGIKISKGTNTADIHGTILSVWAIVMILDLLEKNTYDYKLIRP